LAEKKMTAASLNQGNKPRQSVYLSAETVRVRDALINKFKDKSLEELNAFISMALETEQDEAKRLGVLAARVYILRMRISNVSAFNNDPTMTTVPTLTMRDFADDRSDPLEVGSSDADDTDFDPDKFEEWTELRIIDDGEINGVRFPKDAIITVGPFDAYRLLKTEKADYVTPPEGSEGSTTTIEDVKDAETLDQELDLLSSDDDTDVAANAAPQDADMISPASAADAPSSDDDASDDDASDDDASDDDASDDDAEEGIDPFANR
jgi:hypothetical protein